MAPCVQVRPWQAGRVVVLRLGRVVAQQLGQPRQEGRVVAQRLGWPGQEGRVVAQRLGWPMVAQRASGDATRQGTEGAPRNPETTVSCSFNAARCHGPFCASS